MKSTILAFLAYTASQGRTFARSASRGMTDQWRDFTAPPAVRRDRALARAVTRPSKPKDPRAPVLALAQLILTYCDMGKTLHPRHQREITTLSAEDRARLVQALECARPSTTGQGWNAHLASREQHAIREFAYRAPEGY